MRQTAIDFLIEQIIDKQPAGFYRIDSQEECYELFEKARQMEKEQIMSAWLAGFEETRPYVDHSEDYYKQTYESNTNL